MAADANGMNLDAVFVPSTQKVRFGKIASVPSKSDLLALTNPLGNLAGSWVTSGLTKSGAGNTWNIESDSEEITFEQEGYSRKTGNSTATLEWTAAEYSSSLAALRGQEIDEDGWSTVDAGGSDDVWMFHVTEVSTNNTVRHRVFSASVTVSEETVTRGEVQGYPCVATLIKQFPGGSQKPYHYAELLLVSEDSES